MSQYPSSYKGKRRDQSGPTIFTQIGAALSGIWKLFVKQRGPSLNSAALRKQFDEIERLLSSNDAVHAAQAVVRADSFLDNLMREVGGQGSSFADRLRNLETKFSADIYQQIWSAHKLRNAIAHEHPTVSVAQARSALQVFRRAASQLGAF